MINFNRTINSQLNPMDKCNVVYHDYCVELRKYMLDCIENPNTKYEITDNLIKKFLKIMQEIECWSLDYDKNIQILLYICSNYKLSFDLKKSIWCNINSEIPAIYFNNIDLDSITDIELNNIFSQDNYNSEYIRTILINNLSKNPKYVKKIFYALIMRNDFIGIYKLFDNKFDITYDDFLLVIAKLSIYDYYNIIQDEMNFNSLVNKLILSGGVIKKETMTDIFNKIIDIELKNINQLYQNYYYFNPCMYDFILYLVENNCDIIKFDTIKFFLLKQTFNNSQYSTKELNKIINYLFDQGMKLTKEDVVFLIQHNIGIINYSKLDFPIDCDEIAIEQAKTKKSVYKINDKYDLEILRNYCSTYIKLPKLREICKSVTPDIICLENACAMRNNQNVIRYLCDTFDLKINDKCILNLLKNSGSSIGYIMALKYEKQNMKK